MNLRSHRSALEISQSRLARMSGVGRFKICTLERGPASREEGVFEMTPQTLSLQIESWPIDRLIPYARNARTHSEQQVAQIAASIAEFRFVNPVLVDPEGGIIAGHGRVLAARKLAYTHVPVIVLGHLSESPRRGCVLADNKLTLSGGWDADMLRLELEALAQENFDLDR